jgi:hypothetical protein
MVRVRPTLRPERGSLPLLRSHGSRRTIEVRRPIRVNIDSYSTAGRVIAAPASLPQVRLDITQQ